MLLSHLSSVFECFGKALYKFGAYVVFQLHLDAREVLSDLEPTGDGIAFHPRSVLYDFFQFQFI